ncbi:uncharacterized protein LOC5509712 [Nematostella vectensis]|uniref:uncharacterized protein LOC5509712 n=1 Tax=Nematostella vectensis TaxID=45351 RepID=UPI0020775E40|nr:uncharacterized protein LOC5509712 [Nematostella vectensis]
MDAVVLIPTSESFEPWNDDKKVCEKTNAEFKPLSCVTFSSLFKKDLEDAYIFPERPSSFNHDAKLVNDERYLIHDYPPWPSKYIEQLPRELCATMGDDLPVLLRDPPSEELKEHWSKVLSFFPAADIRQLDEEDTGYKTIVTNYPLQSLPRERHAVDPDAHHKVLCKSTIPEMGASCPYHMSIHDYTIPCMIKVSHGIAGRGTFMAKTQEAAEAIINTMQNEMQCNEPIVTEVIEGITGNLCVQFHLFKSGETHWIGATQQVIGEDLEWEGGIVNWNEQEKLKKLVFKTVRPVKKYLHSKGYFGVVGVDILTTKHEQYVIDLNPRFNCSSALLLMAPHMAAKGYPVSKMLRIPDVRLSEKELMRKIQKINDEGEGVVVTLGSYESQDGSSRQVTACMYARTDKEVQHLHEQLTTAC